MNATLDRYAWASFAPRCDGCIVLEASDLGAGETLTAGSSLPTDGGLRLHRGVYNRMIRDFNRGEPLAMTLTTYVESPLGSGLGSSSALVVAMVELMARVLKAPLGEYEVAKLATEIERADLGLAGGRQDQYAATFGGFNFLEFQANDRVIVNPLRIRHSTLCELEASLLLVSTGASRQSSEVISSQAQSVSAGGRSLEAMHQLKAEAYAMKEALLLGNVREIADVLRRDWEAKKSTSAAVSTALIEELFDIALTAGALAGKVSGAGGGGFVMFVVDPDRRAAVIRAVTARGFMTTSARFTNDGCAIWESQ